MSEKTNKTKIEKKLIASIAIIITIGIATIVPLTVFMGTAKAQTDDPWFNVDLTYAYFSGNVIDDMFHATGIISFDALLNSETVNQQQNIAARIDFYDFLLYTDDIQLSKSYEYIGMDRPGLENPTTMAAFRPDTWILAYSWLSEVFGIDYVNESMLNWNISFHIGSPIPSGGRYISNTTNPWYSIPESWQDMGGAGSRGGYIDEISDTKLSALKNTQTIYLDIRRIASMTIDDYGTVTTSKCDQLVQHIELQKNSSGEFIFNNPTPNMENIISTWMSDERRVGLNGQSSVQFW